MSESYVHKVLSALQEGNTPPPATPDVDANIRIRVSQMLRVGGEDVYNEIAELYSSQKLAMPLFLLKIVVGGVVSMMIVCALCYTIPVHNRAETRNVCAPFDENSLVAHVGDNGAEMFAAPAVYAIGTGMLGATLFTDASSNNGIFDTIRGIRGSAHPVLNVYVAGLATAFVLMFAGAYDYNSDASAACAKTAQKAPKKTTVADLLFSDTSLFVAVCLNFLGDAFMVSECFEYKEMREMPQIIKVLLDNAILVAALAIRARQKQASFSQLIKYGSIIAGIYVLCVGVGISLDRVPNVAFKRRLKGFNSGFVPVVLIWTLLAELAPNAFVFNDDSGAPIPTDFKMPADASYTSKTGKTRRVGLVGQIFNQREAISALCIMVSFYGFACGVLN